MPFGSKQFKGSTSELFNLDFPDGTENVFSQNARDLCNRSSRTGCSNLFAEAPAQFCSVMSCDHRTQTNQESSWKLTHRTSVLTLQPKPTSGVPGGKQPPAALRNNLLFRLIDINDDNIGVCFAHFTKRTVSICFTVTTRIFHLHFCFSTGFDKQYLTTVIQEYILLLLAPPQKRSIKEGKFMSPSSQTSY